MRMIRALVVFCLGLMTCGGALAKPLAGPIPAEVVKIVDGDTLKVHATIWVGQTVEVLVRLRGVDAPELYRPRCEAEKALGRAARDAVAAAVPIGETVLLSEISRDKYGGRVVAEVALPDGEGLGARLIAQGQAVPSGAPKPWC